MDLIKGMKNAGVSLEECREYMKTRTNDKYIDIMLRQQQLLSNRIAELRLLKADVDITIQDCLSMMRFYGKDPMLITKHERFFLTASIEELTTAGITHAYMELFAKRRALKEQYKIESTMLPGLFLPLEQLRACAFRKPSMVCLRLSAPVPAPDCISCPADEYVIKFHRGSRDTIQDSYYPLLEFIDGSCMEPCGDAIEADFLNHFANKKEEKHVKQILIPVRKVR